MTLTPRRRSAVSVRCEMGRSLASWARWGLNRSVPVLSDRKTLSPGTDIGSGVGVGVGVKIAEGGGGGWPIERKNSGLRQL